MIRTYTSISLLLVALGGGLQSVQARPVGTSPKQVISPRSLITPIEVAEYRRAIATAPTIDAKLAIRDATYANLRQRAASRGMIMAEPYLHPLYGGLHWGDMSSPMPKRSIPIKHPTIKHPTAPRFP